MRPTRSDSATGIVAVWAAECVAALLLLLQRLTGTIESFPSPTGVLLFAVVSLAVNLMGLSLLRARPFSRDSEALRRGALLAVACVPPLVIGLSLLHPDATFQQASLWVCVLLAAGMTAPVSRRADCQSVPQAPPTDALLSEDSESRLNAEVVYSLVPDAPVPPPLQSMQRRLADDGSREILEGEFTAVFAAGQKTAVVHVAFCPPLAGIPEVECEPLDGPEVRWKAAVVQPYGLRIDVQRSGAKDGPAEVHLAWFATANCRLTEAA
jgi:hypothetical protein